MAYLFDETVVPVVLNYIQEERLVLRVNELIESGLLYEHAEAQGIWEMLESLGVMKKFGGNYN